MTDISEPPGETRQGDAMDLPCASCGRRAGEHIGVTCPAETPEFPCGWCSGADEHRSDCPSWTAAPPAEARQDDEAPWCNLILCPEREQLGGHRIETGQCIVTAARPSADQRVAEAYQRGVRDGVQGVTELNARPSADTETLRRVRELADELEGIGLAVFADRFRAALDGER